MTRTLQKNIRVTPEQWDRIENAARERDVSANRLVVELVIEALDHREWPCTEHEIQLLRSSLFAAQAIARDMIATGREDEIEEIVATSHKSRRRGLRGEGTVFQSREHIEHLRR